MLNDWGSSLMRLVMSGLVGSGLMTLRAYFNACSHNPEFGGRG